MPDEGERYDYRRYRQLLADAVDDNKRLALIRLLIEERAMDRLAAVQAAHDVGRPRPAASLTPAQLLDRGGRSEPGRQSPPGRGRVFGRAFRLWKPRPPAAP